MGAPLPQLIWAEQRGLQAQPKSPQHCLETPVQPPTKAGWLSGCCPPSLPLPWGARSHAARRWALACSLRTCSSTPRPPRAARPWHQPPGRPVEPSRAPWHTEPGRGPAQPRGAPSCAVHLTVLSRTRCSRQSSSSCSTQRRVPVPSSQPADTQPRPCTQELLPPRAPGVGKAEGVSPWWSHRANTSRGHGVPPCHGEPSAPRGWHSKGSAGCCGAEGNWPQREQSSRDGELGGAKEEGNRGGGCCCSPHRAVTGLSSDSDLETKEELILCSWSSPGSWLR